MIYFMQPVDGGPVKIGYSGNVEARRRDLEKAFGRSLAVLATIEGDRRTEQAMHKRFRRLRFQGTEQFRPDPELMEFIGRPLLVGANPDLVEAMRPRTKSVRLDLSSTTYRRLKIVAAEEGMSMAAYTRKIVLERIGADEERT